MFTSTKAKISISSSRSLSTNSCNSPSSCRANILAASILLLSISLAAASAVPPVAIKSSIMITLSFELIESLWTSKVPFPYSNSKSTEYYSDLPFRVGNNIIWSFYFCSNAGALFPQKIYVKHDHIFNDQMFCYRVILSAFIYPPSCLFTTSIACFL